MLVAAHGRPAETLMPLQKQFDVESAREKAKALFWAKGFEATSMEDLLACMGIGRGSFYATFGGKQGLYIDVLRRYDQKHRRDVLARLGAEPSPRRRILALFEGVRQEACAPKGTRGCFLANAGLELAAADKTVAGIVRAAFAETEEFFHDSVADGQRRGEIRGDIDARATARALLGLLLGMRVLARSGVPGPVLASIAVQVKEML